MESDPFLGQILLQLVLIGLNAIFACAEIAILSIKDSKVAQLVAQGDKRAVRLARLTNQPARFLATIQVAITLSGFLGSAFAANHFSDKLVSLLIGLGTPISAATLGGISVVVITLILSYFTLVFGELVPKRVAMKKAETLALGMASMISFVAKLAAPIIWVLTASTNGILRLFGIDPNAENEVLSEEEIRMMLDLGQQNGVIDLEETQMIHKVFDFNDLSVDAFATHRTKLAFLWMEEGPEAWEQTIRETRFSRYPICGKSADDLIGILNGKDYFRLADKSRENILQNAVYAPYFVPQHICANVLFRQMKESHNHFAVVLDDYGGVFGAVTIYDLLEQLVGDLESDSEMLIEQVDAGTWIISGDATLSNVAKTLAVSLPTQDHETFGSFVFAHYGFIPTDGTQFELFAASLHIQVQEIKSHRLKSALVSFAVPPATI